MDSFNKISKEFHQNKNKNQFHISFQPIECDRWNAFQPAHNFLVPSFIKRARNSFFVTKYPECYQYNNSELKRRMEDKSNLSYEMSTRLKLFAIPRTILYTIYHTPKNVNIFFVEKNWLSVSNVIALVVVLAWKGAVPSGWYKAFNKCWTRDIMQEIFGWGQGRNCQW